MGTYNVHGGHNSIVPGTNMYLNEVTEDRSVKDKVIAYLRAAGHTAYDCTDDSGTTQSRNLSNIVAKCNAHSVDLDISIHLNAGGGTGTEVLYYPGSAEGQAMAAKVSAKIASAFGWKDRGAKGRSDLYVLKNTKAVAILVECCFVDSQADAAAWSADKCAKAIVEAVTGSVAQGTGDSSNSGSTVAGSSGTGGNSIVDYLKSIGQDSSFANRKKLAAQYGISNYTGTAAQNLELLNKLKNGATSGGASSSASGYTGNSLVDYLKSIGKDSSFTARKQYAAQYGITNYSGTAAQNTQLLNLMRGGSAPAASSYYPAFSSSSIVDGLKSIGVDSSFSHRSKIAAANGIAGYSGTATQNNKLCSLAKQGKLKKA